MEKARLSAERQIRELSNQHPEIKNDEAHSQRDRREFKRLREESESVNSHSMFAGKVGSFTGAMAATMTDLIGMDTLRRFTSAGILKTALIEAGYGMLSEAMIQPFV